MAVNHFYDETAGHRIVVASMAEGRPLLRAAMLGAYMELISVVQRNIAASWDSGIPLEEVDTTVSRGDLIVIEPWEADALTDALLKYGLLKPAPDPTRYELVKHPKLAHWEDPEQIYWRKQQRRDTRDTDINRAVRHRDGDQCRACRTLVKWGAPTSDPQGGTFDHVDPRTPAQGNPEALAVTCRRCNGIRSNRPDANDVAPLQPVPEHPFYTPSTADWLRKAGFTGPDGRPLRATGKKWLLPRVQVPAPRTPTSEAAPTPSDPTPSGITQPSEPPENGPESDENITQGQRPGSQPEHAPEGKRPASDADNAPSKTRSEFGASSPEVRQPNSGAPPPDSRTNDPQFATPLPRDGREGTGGVGFGGAGLPPPRPASSKRSRRSKSKPAEEQS